MLKKEEKKENRQNLMLGIKKMSDREHKKRGTKHWNSENVKKRK